MNESHAIRRYCLSYLSVLILAAVIDRVWVGYGWGIDSGISLFQIAKSLVTPASD
ncbi:MAG: hypothetical protein AAGD07_05010 [Planctomycetota bacterium]